MERGRQEPHQLRLPVLAGDKHGKLACDIGVLQDLSPEDGDVGLSVKWQVLEVEVGHMLALHREDIQEREASYLARSCSDVRGGVLDDLAHLGGYLGSTSRRR
jgi:hypothetical protein